MSKQGDKNKNIEEFEKIFVEEATRYSDYEVI